MVGYESADNQMACEVFWAERISCLTACRLRGEVAVVNGSGVMLSAVAWQVPSPLSCTPFTRPSHLSASFATSPPPPHAPKRRRSSRPLLPARCVSCVSERDSRHLPRRADATGVGSDGADSAEPRQRVSSGEHGVGDAALVAAGGISGSEGVPSAASENFEHDLLNEDEEAGPGGLMKDSVLEVKWKEEEAERNAATPSRPCSACSQAGGTIQPIDDPAQSFLFTRIAAPTAWLGGLQPLGTDSEEQGLKGSAETLSSPFSPPSDASDDISIASPSMLSRASDASYRPGPPSLWNIRDESVDIMGDGIIDGLGPPDDDDSDSDAASSVAAFHQRRLESRLENSTPYSPQSLARRMYRYMQAQRNRGEFLEYFRGEFDNYEQVSEQRKLGIQPREGGGHEHIHCSLVQLSDDMLFARYYFNGDPSVVFRSRLYKVYASDETEHGVVEMRIFRFYEETERLLKASNYDISAISWDDDDIYDWLEGCEVYWERYKVDEGEDDAGSRDLGISSGTRFVGYMKGGGCELYSREIDGRIRVMDDLLLTADDLWVADRGFDESGHFVYGNRRGRPYKMKRVNKQSGSSDPAYWTLSSNIPAPEGYEP